MKTVLVIHGPNLNLLGTREPELYGCRTLADINEELRRRGRELGLKVDCFQSNGEGEIVDRIQRAIGAADGVIINPAAYTHTSVAIRDALRVLSVPIIEVHLSNIHRREPFRHKSLTADVVKARLMGFGPAGYRMALEALGEMML